MSFYPTSIITYEGIPHPYMEGPAAEISCTLFHPPRETEKRALVVKGELLWYDTHPMEYVEV
jgi:hypothetical protein